MAEAYMPCRFLDGGGIEHADSCTCGRWPALPEWAQRLVDGQPEIVGSAGWRAAHCEAGDAALELADKCARGNADWCELEGGGLFRSLPDRQMEIEAPVWTAIAAAHYAAANVRYRP